MACAEAGGGGGALVMREAKGAGQCSLCSLRTDGQSSQEALPACGTKWTEVPTL